MKSESKILRRRSIRIKGYDYSSDGVYFVTICAHNRECLFGRITDGEMELSDVGRVLATEWIKTAEIRKEIDLDEWVIMPNHFHGIVVIRRGDRPVARTEGRPVARTENRPVVRTEGRPVAPTAREPFMEFGEDTWMK